MATSEPLVPTNLPYGERQQVRAQMQEAGVPLSPVEGQAPFAEAALTAPPQASPTTADEVARFDALANRQPTVPPAGRPGPGPIEQYKAQAAASGNEIAMAVAQRIAKYLPGA